MIALSDVAWKAGAVEILKGVSVEFAPGRFHAILGPNGAGKSTLMKLASGLLTPTRGKVTIGGRAPDAWAPRELALKRAVLSQSQEVAFPLLAEAVAAMGRYPHYAHAPSARDREIVSEALDLVEMAGHREQPYATLSGGEKQKIQLARVLAQIWPEPDARPDRWLFLDEPTASLDIRHQLQILATARGMLEQGCSVIAVLHDLDQALEHADRVLLVADGRIVHAGEACDGLSPQLIEQVFHVRAEPAQGRWRYRL